MAFGGSAPTRGLLDSAIIGRQNGGVEATVSRANRRANRRGRGVRNPADGPARDPDERKPETAYGAGNCVKCEQATVTIQGAAIA